MSANIPQMSSEHGLNLHEHSEFLAQLAQDALRQAGRLALEAEIQNITQVAEKVMQLGRLALDLQQNSDLMRALQPSSDGQAAAVQLEVAAALPAEPVQPEEAIGVTPEATTHTALEPTPEPEPTTEQEPITEAEVPKETSAQREPAPDTHLQLNQETLEIINTAARNSFGDAARTLKVLTDNTFDLNGTQLTLNHPKSRGDSRKKRTQLLNIFIESKGEQVGTAYLQTRGATSPSLSSLVTGLSEQLTDATGKSVVDIHRLRPRYSEYSLAPDIIIIDERSEQIEEQETTRITEPVSAPELPEDAPEATAPAPAEAPTPEQTTDTAIDTTREQTVNDIDNVKMLEILQAFDSHLDSEVIAQQYYGQEFVSAADTELVEDYLFFTFKTGLIDAQYLSGKNLGYRLNDHIEETRASKTKIEFGGHTVYLDDLDIQLLRAIYNRPGELDNPKIVSAVYDGEYVPDLAFDMGIRSIKKYLTPLGIVGTKTKGSKLKSLSHAAKQSPSLMRLIKAR